MILGEVLYDLGRDGQLMVAVKYANGGVKITCNDMVIDSANYNALLDATGINYGNDSQYPIVERGKRSIAVLTKHRDTHVSAYVVIHLDDRVYRFEIFSGKDVVRLINRIKGYREIERIIEWLMTDVDPYMLSYGHISEQRGGH